MCTTRRAVPLPGVGRAAPSCTGSQWRFSGPLYMMRLMPKKEWITEPCRRCGKTPRYDYDGYCMDCAEDLALRGLVAPPSGQSAGGAAAELDRERTAENEVPYPRVCKKAGEVPGIEGKGRE